MTHSAGVFEVDFIKKKLISSIFSPLSTHIMISFLLVHNLGKLQMAFGEKLTILSFNFVPSE
jgi:hypothetical protein